MGAACSGGGGEETEEERNRNKRIEQQLKKDKKMLEHEIKLLLLGLFFVFLSPSFDSSLSRSLFSRCR
jgi:hypothetical protein